jgi:hypothetical protein
MGCFGSKNEDGGKSPAGRSKPNDLTFTFLFQGDHGVGKTSLVSKYVKTDLKVLSLFINYFHICRLWNCNNHAKKLFKWTGETLEYFFGYPNHHYFPSSYLFIIVINFIRIHLLMRQVNLNQLIGM